MYITIFLIFFFFFNDTATTEIYTLSLHDALPTCISLRAFGSLAATFISLFMFATSWPAKPALIPAALKHDRPHPPIPHPEELGASRRASKEYDPRRRCVLRGPLRGRIRIRSKQSDSKPIGITPRPGGIGSRPVRAPDELYRSRQTCDPNSHADALLRPPHLRACLAHR